MTSASCSPPASAWASPPRATWTWCWATAPASGAHWPTRSPATKRTRVSGSSSTPAHGCRCGSALPTWPTRRSTNSSPAAPPGSDPATSSTSATRRDGRRRRARRRRRRRHRGYPAGGAGVMRTLDPSRTPEYRAAMTVIVGACTLAALGSVFPVVEQATNVGMAGLGILALLVIALRLLVRFVRERLEDAADARTAAAWRAAHHAHARSSRPRLLRGCRDVGRHRLGRRDLAQNHGVPRRSASGLPGCGARPAGSPWSSSPPSWLSCGRIRQLCREWAYEARSSWWWSP